MIIFSDMCNRYCTDVDRELANVRAAEIRMREPFEELWAQRERVRACPLHDLRVHTVLWDFHQAYAEYHRAAERLRDHDSIEQALRVVNDARRHPDIFRNEFNAAPDRKFVYKLWRQRLMALLAHGFSAYQLQEGGSNDVFAIVELFLERCLDPFGYSSNSARARLHFFRGIVNEADYEMDRASWEYDLSLAYCKSRAVKELAIRTAGRHQTERSFIVYCLGKMELRLGQLDFDRGRLTAAERHANEAGLMLRTCDDPIMPYMADLLGLKVARYKEGFLDTGWDLVAKFEKCAGGMIRNRPYKLEALIEAIKTSVYLLHFKRKPPLDEAVERSLPQTLLEIEEVIDEAGDEFCRLSFDALLVKARILNRIAEDGSARFSEALEAVAQAERRMNPIPLPLVAEAAFVRGKIHVSWMRSEKNPALKTRSRERALANFEQADNAGHASVTFQISCKLQMAELHLDSGRGRKAQELIAAARELAFGVEHTFLNKRLDEIEARIEGSIYYRFFDKRFDIEKARDELEIAYLQFVARDSNYDVKSFHSTSQS